MKMVRFSAALISSVSGLALAQAAWAAAAASGPSSVDEVVVTAPREEAQARVRQQEAPNLIDVQSAETIAKYPDFNAAEALGRIPGISLSSDTGEGRFVNIRGIDANLNGATYGGVVLLNTNAGGTAAGGGGRAVEFDTIPTGAIDGIVVTKTRLPDQEGEGLGGTIELTPRSAAHLDMPFVEGTLGWGYEPLHKHTGPTDVELAGGARFGFGDRGLIVAGDGQTAPVRAGWISNPYPFSFVMNASRKDDRRAVDDLEAGYIDDTGVAAKADAGIQGKAFSSVDFRRYDYHRRRFGYGGEFDFEPNDDHTYYARASIAGYTEAVHKNFYLLRNLDGAEQDDGSVPRGPDGTTFLASGQAQETLTDEQETHRNQVYVIGGRDRLGDALLDYRAAYSRATFAVGYNIGARFVGPTVAVDYNNITNSTTPSFTYPSGFNPDTASAYNLNRITNSTEHDVDEEYSYAGNLQVPIKLVNDSDRLKVGAEARLRDKTVNPFIEDGIVAPTLNLAAASGPANQYYDGHYPNGPFINRYAIRAILVGQAGTTTDDLDQSGFFTAKENIFAAYAQYTTDIGKWGFLAGARVETTHATYSAFQTTTDAAGNDTTALVARKDDYTNVFPTAQVKYSFAPNLIARAIFSTGIGRPGFEQVAAASSVDFSNSPVLISRGNPNLKPITGDNFDLSLEYYLDNGGIIQAALFDKEFQNYIAPRVQHGITTDPLAPGQLADVTTFLNLSGAHARGAEVAYHQKFTFLPDPFKGFGVEANLTLVDSRVLEYDAATSATGTNQFGLLPGTSKVTWNLAGFYEDHGLQLRLSSEYVSHSLFGLGGDKALDVLQHERLTMDFTSSYQLTHNFTVYFNAKNLLNTPLRYDEGSANRPIQREFYDVTYEAGVRAKF
ncbi:TonB-dependent receptor [Phenylobacterium sp.]|jgi:TonB-dependent receptor|uniref:TonB-dependent receptor n=1 Tax=Phenylobacterium sp. TaxID=1871053 RepID=UPI002F41A91C